MTDVERLITLRKAIIAHDIEVDHDKIICLHTSCEFCTAGPYCGSFPASNHSLWLQGSSAFFARVKYRIPSIKSLRVAHPEYFI